MRKQSNHEPPQPLNNLLHPLRLRNLMVYRLLLVVLHHPTLLKKYPKRTKKDLLLHPNHTKSVWEIGDLIKLPQNNKKSYL
jgi:hypothetical protein